MDNFEDGLVNSSIVIAKGPRSNRVCYFIMPKGVKEDVLAYIDGAAQKYQCTIVIISGPNWNDDLTPWPAPGVFKAKKPFGGGAETFLKTLESEYFPKVEQALRLDKAQRYLIGLSLSGLFAVWTATKTDIFAGIASISGSLWYDDFANWFSKTPIKNPSARYYICLGDREKDTRQARMSCVEICTQQVVQTLQSQGIYVEYDLFDGTHFSPIVPRLDNALKFLTQS